MKVDAMKNKDMKEGGLLAEVAGHIEDECSRTMENFTNKRKPAQHVQYNIYGRGRVNSMSNNVSFEEAEYSERRRNRNDFSHTQAVRMLKAPARHMRSKVRGLVSKLSGTMKCLRRRSTARNDVDGMGEPTSCMACDKHEASAPIPLLLFSGRPYHVERDQSVLANVSLVTPVVGQKQRRSCHDDQDGHDMNRTAVVGVLQRTEAEGVGDIEMVDDVEDVGDIEVVDDMLGRTKPESESRETELECGSLTRLSSQWSGRFPTLKPSNECSSLDERHRVCTPLLNLMMFSPRFRSGCTS